MSEFTTVAKVGDIDEGKGVAYAVNGRMVAIFLENGEYSAIDDFCPHMGASLAGGYVENNIVACPWHAWRFSTKDGTWCENPKISVDAFEVRVVDDNIQVKVPPKDLPEEGSTCQEAEGEKAPSEDRVGEATSSEQAAGDDSTKNESSTDDPASSS